MDIGAVMDEMADALGTIDGLRVFAYFPDRISPPVAVVDFPAELDYDSAFSRGADRIKLPVTVLVSRVDSRTARDRLLGYQESVKAAIEVHTPVAYDSARVTGVEFNHSVPVAAVEYAAATFTIDIIG